MSIVDRILKIVENKGISANKMTEIIGVSGTYFYKQKTNNGNVGSQILMKIVEVYPDISTEWLLTGKGSMIRSDINGQVINNHGNYNNANTGSNVKQTQSTIDNDLLKKYEKLKIENITLKAELKVKTELIDKLLNSKIKK